jgi:hypothetical protein
MTTLENIFATICLGGLCVIMIAAIIALVVMFVGLVINYIKELKSDNFVHCKDCKYWFKNNSQDKTGCPIVDSNIWMDDNDFCSHGEKKDAQIFKR